MNTITITLPTDATIAKLVDAYNYLSSKPVKTFKNKTIAAERVTDLLTEHLQADLSDPVGMDDAEHNCPEDPAGYVAQGYINGFTDNADLDITIVVTTSKRRGRKATKVDPVAVITVSPAPCPVREKTRRRRIWDKFQSGITVQQFLDEVREDRGSSDDVLMALAKEYITLAA